MTRIVLDAKHLRREFGDRVAVEDVSVGIERGQIISLLGPNGAGKTTTVRMCATLLTPTSGSIEVAGINAIVNPRAARKKTGLVLGGDTGFYSRASARKNLLFFADVAGLKGNERKSRVSEALEAVSLADRGNDPVREFSRGMKQRLHIARAMLAQPELLLLDEPTTGLDPQVAADTRSLVKELADRGTAILLTSHHMGEVEQLADRIQVIASGREIAQGSVADIAAASGVVGVSTFSSRDSVATLSEYLGTETSELEISEQAGRWQVRVPWLDTARPELIESWFIRDGKEIPLDLISRRATLEESYLALVSKVEHSSTESNPTE